MFKRKAVTLIALALTGVFFLCSPFLQDKENYTSAGQPLLRVWLLDDEAAVSRWLKNQAARYEKETEQRIYLRAASSEEMEAAQNGKETIIPPDLMIMQGLEAPLLFRGYALIIRDDKAEIITPAPTSALFYRPTSTPGPSPTPPPDPDLTALSPILTPAFLSPSLPGCRISQDTAADFIAGKAPAALLTAGQVANLSFGYRAYALKNGEGLLAVNAHAISESGAQFLSFLQDAEAQIALSQYGLYSCRDDIRLYDDADPIRAMIEISRPAN